MRLPEGRAAGAQGFWHIPALPDILLPHQRQTMEAEAVRRSFPAILLLLAGSCVSPRCLDGVPARRRADTSGELPDR